MEYDEPQKVAVWREKHDAIGKCYYVCSNCNYAVSEDNFYEHTTNGWVPIHYLYCPRCGYAMMSVRNI